MRDYSGDLPHVGRCVPPIQQVGTKWQRTWRIDLSQPINLAELNTCVEDHVPGLIAAAISSLERYSAPGAHTRRTTADGADVSIELRGETTLAITITSADVSFCDEFPLLAAPLFRLLESSCGAFATIQSQPRDVWLR